MNNRFFPLLAFAALFASATASAADSIRDSRELEKLRREFPVLADPATCEATGRDLDPRYDNIEFYLNSP